MQAKGNTLTEFGLAASNLYFCEVASGGTEVLTFISSAVECQTSRVKCRLGNLTKKNLVLMGQNIHDYHQR